MLKYNTQKNIFLCLLSLFLLLLCSCQDSTSIVGKWTVAEFEIDGEVIAIDDAREYMGEDFASIYNYTLEFSNKNKVNISVSWLNESVVTEYSIDGNNVVIIDENGFTEMAIKQDNNKLVIDMNTFKVILAKD